MKIIHLLVGLATLLAFAGCRDDKASLQLIDRAEALLAMKPDSAYLLLDSLDSPEELSERQLARWCMLYGNAADQTKEEMPYVSQLKRAQDWFLKHGTAEEQARIGLFLGRSYVEDKEYDKAMDAYKPALDIAIKANIYNQAGYICSYMADLYDFDEMDELAGNKYKEAAAYFQKAKNERSYAFALRDIGQMYAFMDSGEVALAYLQKADTIVSSLRDSLAMASVYNGLGNVYAMLGQLELAEKYQFESIRLDSTDDAPNYLALADVYEKNGNYQKARFYVNKASISSYNEYVPVMIVYQSYLIEKADGNTDKAFMYLEEYESMADSIKALQNEANIIEVEKRYDHLKTLTDNMQLRVDKQHNLILLISLIALCLFLLVTYQVGISRRNRKIYEQQKALSKQDNHILHLSQELREKKDELSKQALSLQKNKQLHHIQKTLAEQENLYHENKKKVEQLNDKLIQLRQDRLQTSAIAQKLHKLSAKVIPGKNKSLLSEKDWQTIMDTVDDIYLPFANSPLLKDLHITPTELRYCYLVLFELDVNAEAILLNISVDSVSKNYQRLRKKLEIKGGKHELYTYLANSL